MRVLLNALHSISDTNAGFKFPTCLVFYLETAAVVIVEMFNAAAETFSLRLDSISPGLLVDKEPDTVRVERHVVDTS